MEVTTVSRESCSSIRNYTLDPPKFDFESARRIRADLITYYQSLMAAEGGYR